MANKNYFYSILLLFLSTYSFAQTQTLSESDYLRKYKQAVQLFANQKYAEAQSELTPLTLRKYSNALSPYVHYYHAAASIKLNRNYDARISLRQLMERYPNWSKIDEAYYLYANANFLDGYMEEGVTALEEITSPDLKKEGLSMQYNYLSTIKDDNQLKQLNLRHPNNPIIAQILVDKILANKRPSRDDLELSDRLTNRFNLGTVKKSNIPYRNQNSPKEYDFSKDYVNVAVLLPFRINDFDPNKRIYSNDYVYEMYEGMKLAKEKLAAEKITLNLFAFDIDKDADPMLELVNNNALANMDILVGPLYPETNKIASSVSQENEIVQVHPLSNNAQLITNQTYTFLASPSYEVQAGQAIDFIKESNPDKSVAIYFGNSKKDSAFAYTYRDKAMSKGLNVIYIKKYTSEYDIDAKRKPGHIFIAGSDDTIGAKIVLALDKKKISCPIMATSTAFQFESTSLSIFNRQLYLIQPTYIDYTKEEVKNFRSAYINDQNIFPSYFGYWGYDFTLFFSRMLANGKKNLRDKLNYIEYTQGYTLSGFDYTDNANINQIVPIIQYQDGKFIELNR